MNSTIERDILRQLGELIKRAELAHRWFVRQRGPFAAPAVLLRGLLDSRVGFSSSKPGLGGYEIAMLGSRAVRSPNTNPW